EKLFLSLSLTALFSIPLVIHIYEFIHNPHYTFLKESKDQVVLGLGLPPTFMTVSFGLLVIFILRRHRGEKNIYPTIMPLG
ncbi:hypothetical protein, partial [Vibrio parahaemolyticus]|uniref:hypothetical protein n=1 Tax=Vibrio parahaemolyticus TaxID=670 RepID=UPI001A8FD23A